MSCMYSCVHFALSLPAAFVYRDFLQNMHTGVVGETLQDCQYYLTACYSNSTTTCYWRTIARGRRQLGHRTVFSAVLQCADCVLWFCIWDMYIYCEYHAKVFFFCPAELLTGSARTGFAWFWASGCMQIVCFRVVEARSRPTGACIHLCYRFVVQMKAAWGVGCGCYVAPCSWEMLQCLELNTTNSCTM